MNSRPKAPRVLTAVSILLFVVGLGGLIASIFMNSFVLDKFNAYGDVPIPGTATVELPKGDMTINFHARVTGGRGSSLPVPKLKFQLIPPDGVPDPDITEKIGSSITINNDAHVRVWVAKIETPGTYTVTTSGEVNGYIKPRLAFGRDSSSAWWPISFGAMIGVGVIGVIVSGVLRSRTRTTSIRVAPTPSPFQSPPSHFPTDDGVRIEQLKTLAALRDSGALTEQEFETEKRRVLGEG